MRISWLSSEEIAAAREALTAGGATWDSHFTPEFVAPAPVPGPEFLDWRGLTEHVARAERVSEVVRDAGLAVARVQFGESTHAIEAATLAAAAHANEELGVDEVLRLLALPIDIYVFYAPFLELLVELGRGDERTVAAYERFVAAYATAMTAMPHGSERLAATRDGLADFYVTHGLLDEAQALFEQRHDEDRGDVAVALSASRAFYAHGASSHAVRWLGVGAARAQSLGKTELAEKLRAKQESVRKRLS